MSSVRKDFGSCVSSCVYSYSSSRIRPTVRLSGLSRKTTLLNGFLALLCWRKRRTLQRYVGFETRSEPSKSGQGAARLFEGNYLQFLVFLPLLLSLYPFLLLFLLAGISLCLCDIFSMPFTVISLTSSSNEFTNQHSSRPRVSLTNML